MLIICAGMLRSGSTVQRQIVSALVDKLQLGETIAPVNKQQLVDNYEAWALSERWYVYKIHEYVAMPEAKYEHVKVLTTMRDLYDVTVSLMHFLNKDFEATIHSTEWLSNIPNVLSWLTAYPRLCISDYETLVHQLLTEVWHIAGYLNCTISVSEAEQIAAQCSLAANRQRIAANKPFNDPDYMAARQIYHGLGAYSKELTMAQIKQVKPLSLWWLRFRNKYV